MTISSKYEMVFVWQSAKFENLEEKHLDRDRGVHLAHPI